MNIPFSFDFSGSGTEYGVLWNPWNADVTGGGGTVVANTVLTGLVNPLIVSLIPPYGPFWIDDFTIMTDDAGDGACSIGYYDVTAGAFVVLYPIVTTAVAGSGIVRGKMKSGFLIPAGSTRVPCIRYDGASGAVLTGDLGLFIPSSYAVGGGVNAPLDPLLDDLGAPINDDSLNLLYAG